MKNDKEKFKNQRINIRVQPKSFQKKVELQEDGSYKVYVTVAPENGKANEEVIALLAKELGIKKYNIEIVTGLTSRTKVVKIETDS